ncbi:MAG: DNA polymerase III subunit gamma/tau [Thermomicrobiales bacterium]|nr:DNA polymerase III subunit gamma/tau [Thermomicrobiales bacterium]
MLPASDADAQGPGQTQSLYRKYRPINFESDELVGQSHVSDTLRNAIARGRVAHAYLFCGPRGTGKTSTARLLAKAVNCLDPDPLRRPCNVCEACRAINEGRATDIIEIDAASNRGIDDMKALRETVRYAPSQLRHKFYIIDEAHQITRDGFNAFLKTLEEPPANTTFVLATTDPDKLPDTIASRCQRFDFRRIPREPMAEHIRAICAKEGLEIDDDAVDLVVRRATGSLRDALSLVDLLATAAASTESGRIDAELTRKMLGISTDGWELDLAKALADRDVKAGLQVVASAADSGQDMRSFARHIGDVLRLLLLVRAGADPVEATDNIRELAARFELADLLRINERFSELDFKVRTAGFAQLPIELAVVGALVEQPAIIHVAPQAEPQRTQRPAPQRPAAQPPTSWGAPPAERPAPPPRQQDPASEQRTQRPPAAKRPAASATGTGPIADVLSQWDRIRSEIKAMNGKIEALLRESDPESVVDGTLHLIAPYSFHVNRLNEPAARDVIEAAVERVMGTRYHVEVSLREGRELPDSPAPTPVRASSFGSPPESAPPATAAAAPDEAVDQPPANDQYRVNRAKSIFDATEVDPDELTNLR